MKKVLLLLGCLVFLINSTAAAEKPKGNIPEFPENIQANSSVLEFFILDLYYEDIMMYLKKQYGDVKGYQLANDGKPNVSIRFSKGLEKKISDKYSYLIKIRLVPLKSYDSSDIKQSDIVNIYMAADPSRMSTERKIPSMEIINY